MASCSAIALSWHRLKPKQIIAVDPCEIDFLELSMANTYTVEIKHQGTVTSIEVPADQPILVAANEAGLDLPFSCNAGVCTTCAALITEGTVDQTDGMGVGPDLQAAGYALLCVALPRSDVKLETEQEDIVYQKQFGQPT